ncbi:MAG: tetratricopeptide repeat protein [Proteobacteria bacterium]|nr:tetratricopeptide repeat protein [Pseudomonadota bacterium]
MEETGVKRKLAVILAADFAGYSRLMGADEEATLKTLGAYREIIDGLIAGHDGRIFNTAGDSVVAEFASAVEAVRAAISIQQELSVRNAGLADGRKMHLRIGINLGDVMVQRDNLLGDGVNVAARLEGLAEPGGICVSDMVYQSVEAKLDLVFEDLGAQSVKNIAKPVRTWRIVPGSVASPASSKEPPRPQFWPRLGVLAFAAIVVAVLAITGAAIWNSYLPSPTPADEGAPETGMALPLPDKPSIAVLPFTNMSADPDQEYFSDGITEDIITDLSKISGLFVIARNSTFVYKGRAVKVSEVAKELGVRYVLEGSVRKVGERVRINAQLIDAVTGGHLWAERYDGTLADVFALQDKVTEKIVAALAVKLTQGEQERLNRTVAVDPEAYDVLLHGLARLRRFTRETNAEARQFFERAVEIDPQYARAHADVALTHALDVEYGWTSLPKASLQAAVKHTQAALALESSDPHVYFALAMTYMGQRRYDEAIAVGRKATGLYPNYADGFAQLAQSLTFAGKSPEALIAIRKAMRINPRHSLIYLWIVGHNYFLMERYEEAITELRKVVEGNPGYPWAHLTLAAAYGLTGQIEEAEWEGQEFLALQPDFTLARERQRVLYKNSEHRDRYIEGLRKAGLPETSKAAAP